MFEASLDGPVATPLEGKPDTGPESVANKNNRSSPLFVRVGRILVIALALLSFPSVLPWMVAFWITCHTVLAKLKRPAWVPLLICLLILIVKFVPRTPGVLAMGLVLAGVLAIRFRQRKEPQHIRRWWLGSCVLWIAWCFLLVEWNAIEHSSRQFVFSPDRPIVCIGDSLTDGVLPDHGFPAQLESMVSVPVINLGISGISASQGLGQMDRVLEHHPQVVVIELGGHDFLKGHSRQATKENLLAMIHQCHDSGAEVLLMEIPRGFIFDPYASLEREIAYQEDVELVPDTWLRQIVIMGPASLIGMLMPNSRLSDDGIHSNPKGSLSIANHVASSLHQMYGDQVLAAEE